MQWKLKFFGLLVLAIPAFSGFPLSRWDGWVVPGVSWAWAAYCFVTHAALRTTLGWRIYTQIVAISTLVTLPVIFAGGSLSYLLYLLGIGEQADPYGFGAHYLSLGLTMLTVVPLALAMMALLPFHAFEHQLLKRVEGVTPTEKKLLMAIRVFNHIVHDVIPNILEVTREEHPHGHWFWTGPGAGSESAAGRRFGAGGRRFAALFSDMIQIGVEGICAAVQYIPLWAVELSQLPERKKNRTRSKLS
jgi:hypothetical protein